MEVIVHHTSGGFRVINNPSGGYTVEKYISYRTRHFDCIINIDDTSRSTVPEPRWVVWAHSDDLEKAKEIADQGLVPDYIWRDKEATFRWKMGYYWGK